MDFGAQRTTTAAATRTTTTTVSRLTTATNASELTSNAGRVAFAHTTTNLHGLGAGGGGSAWLAGSSQGRRCRRRHRLALKPRLAKNAQTKSPRLMGQTVILRHWTVSTTTMTINRQLSFSIGRLGVALSSQATCSLCEERE